MILIPIGLDQDEVRRTPFVSYAIIAINLGVFVLEWMSAMAGGSPLTRWGYIPAEPRFQALFTSLFIHAGLLHLAGNMLFFFVTGPFIEDAYGRTLFLFLYLASGAFAGRVHGLMSPGSFAPLVGASGAIAGVMGAFLVRLARRRIRFFWMPLPPFPLGSRQVVIPAFVFLPLWFAEQIVLAGLTRGTGGGVALWAHAGGFAFGAMCAIVIAITGLERRVIHPAIEARVAYRADDELLRAVDAGQSGDSNEARRIVDRVLVRKPGDIDARRYAYEIALEARDREAIARHAARLLDDYIEGKERDLAAALIRETTETADASLTARFLLRAGGFLASQGQRQESLHLYRLIIDRFPTDPLALRAFLQAAALAREAGHLEEARSLLERGLTHPACASEWRATFQTRLAQLARSSAPGGYRGTRGTGCLQ